MEESNVQEAAPESQDNNTAQVDETVTTQEVEPVEKSSALSDDQIFDDLVGKKTEATQEVAPKQPETQKQEGAPQEEGTVQEEGEPQAPATVKDLVDSYGDAIAEAHPEFYEKLYAQYGDNGVAQIIDSGADLVTSMLTIPKEQSPELLGNLINFTMQHHGYTPTESLGLVQNLIKHLKLEQVIQDSTGVDARNALELSTYLVAMDEALRKKYSTEADQTIQKYKDDFAWEDSSNKIYQTGQIMSKDTNSYPMFAELFNSVMEQYIPLASSIGGDIQKGLSIAYNNVLELNPELKARVNAQRVQNRAPKVNGGVSEVANAVPKANPSDYIDPDAMLYDNVFGKQDNHSFTR